MWADLFTAEKLAKILEHNNESSEWFNVLARVLPDYEIDTPERLAAFLSQCAHESGDFTTLRENLNYSSDALTKVFKKYFPTAESALPYHRKAEKIANRVYANRMGNGDEASGDGFKYRGRGLIQLTGKKNYTTCSQFLFKDNRLLDNPDYLTTKGGAVESACWYWDTNGLNLLADTENVEAVTKRINGGTIGLAHRQEKYDLAISILRS